MSIDNGLTTTKAVIFSLDGHEIATSVVDTVIENKGDWAEIDMELQWTNTVSAIQEVLAKSAINPAEIIGIGNSGHGAGVYLLDRYGNPVRKAISSMDGRAADINENWRQNGITNYALTYQNMWLGQPVPLLYWLKQNEPSNYQKVHTILMAKDWIRYRLTGELNLEYTDASNSGLVNLTAKALDPEIFRPYGISEIYDKLPPLRKSMTVAGNISKKAAQETGLKERTPVIGGLFDVVACALGSGIYDNQKYSITAGTWNINSGVEEKIFPSQDIMEWVMYADNERYMCIDSSATSAVNLEWFIKNIILSLSPESVHPDNIYQLINEKIARFTPEEVQIIYLPFIYKSKLTHKTEGGFFGMKASHNVYHLLRAVYEGVAFAHLKHLDNLRKGGIVKQIGSLSGGASKSPFWSQLFADILNIEIVTTKASQVGALGIAIASTVATGVYPSIEDAVRVMVGELKRYHPGQDTGSYREKYQRFNRIIDLYDHNIL
ncbi:MAG TPA: FGGY-family carbohydrate kinase [Bacillota bacterium]|nr:FGGY-family carbohydrate kinase [Bacillota bacterium]